MRTVVIGGGLAGLASAALAARRGERVLLLEQDRLGGKSARVRVSGQTVDTGPSLVSFPQVWRDLEARLLADLPVAERDAARVDFLPLPGLGVHHYQDQALELPLPPGHPLYAAWQGYLERQRPLAAPIARLLVTPPGLRPEFLRASAALAAEYGLRLRADRYLDALGLPEPLRAAIGVHSFNGGLGPERASALYASLPGAMLAAPGGVVAPRGGVYTLTLFLEAQARRLGADLRAGWTVRAIDRARRVVQARAPGGRLEEFAYDRVISAVDEGRTRVLLGGPAQPPARLTCSGVAIYAALREPLEAPLPRASVVLPDDLRAMSDALARLEEPQQTMALVHHDPPGELYPDNDRTVLSVLLTAPANGRRYDLESGWVRAQLRRISRVLGLRAPLEELLRAPAVLTPADYAAGGAWGGAIYGRVRPLWQAGPFHRPGYLEGGVWQVGTSVHPGGGIPGVLGGALIADALMSGRGRR
ncbi:phytoene dehydrogenase-like protein [Deinobacterium chartae]|uniref:Phytoene dehydrogenase-like protein n=1 Tax=Deinobacterium chartae TaxID=521158 RepID=A0A841I0U7_9DEIO|nr:phytoene dehydrogenase-like protein [Deinobacterium chartae]